MARSRKRYSAAETDQRIRLKGRSGPPSEADRPKPKVFPGKRIKPVDGQLDIDGGEYVRAGAGGARI